MSVFHHTPYTEVLQDTESSEHVAFQRCYHGLSGMQTVLITISPLLLTHLPNVVQSCLNDEDWRSVLSFSDPLCWNNAMKHDEAVQVSFPEIAFLSVTRGFQFRSQIVQYCDFAFSGKIYIRKTKCIGCVLPGLLSSCPSSLLE